MRDSVDMYGFFLIGWTLNFSAPKVMQVGSVVVLKIMKTVCVTVLPGDDCFFIDCLKVCDFGLCAELVG